MGLVADDTGRVRAATAMDLEISRSADGYWHDGIRMSMDGEEWELVPDPQGRMMLGRLPNPQQEGLMRRGGRDSEAAGLDGLGRDRPGTRRAAQRLS